jgi:hypothetical protein
MRTTSERPLDFGIRLFVFSCMEICREISSLYAKCARRDTPVRE